MATEDVKKFLTENFGVPENQWKRISKQKLEDGSELRVFQNKSTGATVETLESKVGVITIVDSNKSELSNTNLSTKINSNEFSPAQIKAAKNLINKFLEEGNEPEETRSGFAAIPTFFNFSFLEDANCDWTEELENISKSKNPNSSVAGVNVFFSFKSKGFEDYSCIHLEPLLYQFLPGFMLEIEESTFHLEEDNVIPYNKFIATLEAKGFTYNKSNCMLANLDGSGNASPIVPDKNETEIKPSFAILAVVNVSFQEPYPQNPKFTTAIVLEDKNLKTRKAKEKFVNNALKKYVCCSPGRLSNGHIPQLDAIQLVKKSNTLIYTEDKDRQAIFELLINEGWKFDSSLATIEKAQNWKCEPWTIEPFAHDNHMFSNVLATRTDLTYGIWQPPQPQIKPKI